MAAVLSPEKTLGHNKAPFYIFPSLLRPGSHDFSYSLKKKFDDESVSHLEAAAKARENMYMAMTTAPTNSDHIASSIEAYLPLSLSLSIAFGTAASAATVTFPWRTGIGAKQQSIDSTVFFENLLTHMAYAFAMRNLAADKAATTSLLGVDFEVKWRDVVSNFRAAAGAVEYASNLILAEGSPAGAMFPECNFTILTAVKKLFIAEGQMAMVTAAQCKGTDQTLIAKLCVRVFELMTEVHVAFESSRGQATEIDSVVINYVSGTRLLYKCLAQRMAAAGSLAKQDYGIALGYAAAAKKIQDEEIVPFVQSAVGYGILSAALPAEFTANVDSERRLLANLTSRIETENRAVAHENLKTGPTIEGVIVFKSEEFKPRPLVFSSLTQHEASCIVQ